MTDEAVLSELGARLARLRLGRNLTQADLASAAGVERKVVLRIEAGEVVNDTSFVRVLRALDLLEALDRLIPESGPTPIELVDMRGRGRRRASGGRHRGHDRDGGAPWRWGDQSPDTG
ncbi:MAG TPA: helix-turn-helix domain-containing protein [Solirubrobacteraceae bacterium]|jgi:transcriptional regulator with XRE-family HTH domain|nr:helix-turn-helix domain-containing protein [Solirubrobacteraceae bacterium]